VEPAPEGKLACSACRTLPRSPPTTSWKPISAHSVVTYLRIVQRETDDYCQKLPRPLSCEPPNEAVCGLERLPGLGRHAEWRLVEVGLIGCAPVKARVRSAADRCAGLGYAVVGKQQSKA
jgi:hypothetical protein